VNANSMSGISINIVTAKSLGSVNETTRTASHRRRPPGQVEFVALARAPRVISRGGRYPPPWWRLRALRDYPPGPGVLYRQHDAPRANCR
jgi:hypothetical protein